MAPLCLWELARADETVERPGQLVLLLSSCPQRLLAAVLTLLTLNITVWPPVRSGPLSLWVKKLASIQSKLLDPGTQALVMVTTGISCC